MNDLIFNNISELRIWKIIRLDLIIFIIEYPTIMLSTKDRYVYCEARKIKALVL